MLEFDLISLGKHLPNYGIYKAMRDGGSIFYGRIKEADGETHWKALVRTREGTFHLVQNASGDPRIFASVQAVYNFHTRVFSEIEGATLSLPTAYNSWSTAHSFSEPTE